MPFQPNMLLQRAAKPLNNTDQQWPCAHIKVFSQAINTDSMTTNQKPKDTVCTLKDTIRWIGANPITEVQQSHFELSQRMDKH